jgi:hypothetical protein
MDLRRYMLVSRDDIRGNYENPKCYQADNCIGFLTTVGWFPLSVDENFPHFNLLSNFAFYSGCVTRKNIVVTGTDYQTKEIKRIMSERMKIDMKIRNRDGRSEISFEKQGCGPIARMIEAAGVPRHRGNKIYQIGLDIPRYRKELFELTEDSIISNGQKEIVRTLERDATGILLSTKCYPVTKLHWRVRFFPRQKEDDAKTFGMKNIKLINFSVPGLDLECDQIKVEKRKNGHIAYIDIPREKAEFILDGNRDLLRFGGRLNKLYPSDMPFEPADISGLLKSC